MPWFGILGAKKEVPSARPVLPKITLTSETLNSLIQDLKQGLPVVKHGRMGFAHEKLLSLGQGDTALTYAPSKKGTPRILLKDIQEIRREHRTQVFQCSWSRGKAVRRHCFSLVLKSGETLDLELGSEEAVNELSQAITYLQKTVEQVYKTEPHKMRLLELWLDADVDGSKALSVQEVTTTVRKLNIGIEKRALKALFAHHDRDLNGFYDFDEFAELYSDLSFKPEAALLFRLYAHTDLNFMTISEFTAFMRTEQGELRWTDDSSLEVLRALRVSLENNRLAFTLGQFTTYLLDPERNSAWNRDHLKVFQDMDQPMVNYFINSSHNTYLSGDQLQSESKTEMYQLSLIRGCRSVEIDCWDGPDGEPIVYHGYTRTTKILFKDVIETIGRYAFETSPYPVSLSLEVHTSVAQQGKMAHYMKTILGEKLAPCVHNTPNTSPWTLTPEKLKHKVLVKAKMFPIATLEEVIPKSPHAPDAPASRISFSTAAVTATPAPAGSALTLGTTPNPGARARVG
eukprot:RCo039313